MTDHVSAETRSKIMRAVKSKKTGLEEKIAANLRKRGIHMRRNVNSLFGKPDFALKGKKVVVFIDSCFWHGCESHSHLPKSNIEFWSRKIKRNRQRDSAVNEYYKSVGWKILRFWQHDIKANIDEVINTICRAVNDE